MNYNEYPSDRIAYDALSMFMSNKNLLIINSLSMSKHLATDYAYKYAYHCPFSFFMNA